MDVVGINAAKVAALRTGDRRYTYRHRPIPPIGSTINQELSGETFTTPVTFTTTAPTISNSINFTYLTAGPLMTGHGANLSSNSTFAYLYNSINGASATSSAWAVGVEHYGAHIAFKFRTQATTAQYWIFIDDKPVTAAPVALTGLTSGTTYYLNLPFTTTAMRRIKVWVSVLHSQGYICAKTDTYGPTPLQPFNILFWGDSWFQGANGIFLDHYPLKIARALGAEAYLCAQGGTGYVNAGPGSGSSQYGSADRLLYAQPVKPDLIWVNGSVNDQSFAASVQAAATSFFSSLATQYSGVPVVVQGVQAISSGAGFGSNHNIANNGVVAAATASPNVIGIINPRSEGWVTGSGNSSTPTTDGNADVIQSSDYIHLTATGNDYYARRSIASVIPLLSI